MQNQIPHSSNEASKLHFLDYWRIIRIRKTVIFAVFLLVLLTTTIVTVWLPKYYASTVRIAIEKDMPDIPGLFDLRQAASVGYDPYFIQDQFEKIQSKSVLYNVITNLGLNDRWSGKFNAGIPLQISQAYLILKRHLDVRQYRNTSLIEIRVLSEEKEEASQIANKIADAYKQWRLGLRREASLGGIKVLEEQLKDQDNKVSTAQTKVNQLRQTLGISDSAVDSGQVSTLEPETVRRMEGARIDALASYSQIQALLTNLFALSKTDLRKALPTAYPDPVLTELLLCHARTEQELTTLRKDYGEQNPDVDRAKGLLEKIDEQIDIKTEGILAGLQAKALSLKGELDARTQQLEEAKLKDIENARKYSEYFMVKRDLESEKQIRQTMMLRIIQETVDAALPKSAIVEVVDIAEPGLSPVRPNFTLNIALGIIVGLVVGVGLAFFIEYLDTSVKTIDDVERSLQSPVLGVIPQNVGFILEEGADSPHAEAYRVLRTNLLFSRKDDKLNTLTIVSGGAGEGKSTTVFNLSTVFAQSGQRVLMVDSDLRRPSLHKFLRVSNSVGLTNYLLKQKGIEETIQTTSMPTLDFMPSGKLPSSSIGILNSPRMKEFITEVKKRYDIVFFDSPPIMGVSDASILASVVDMTLLVVQYRKYPQLMTTRAKQMVEKVGGLMMGVVLNNINISQDSYYYYYSGYYYDYYSKDYAKKQEETPASGDGEKTEVIKEQAKLELRQKY